MNIKDFCCYFLIIGNISRRLIVFHATFVIFSIYELKGFFGLLCFQQAPVRVILCQGQLFALVSSLLRSWVLRVSSLVSPFLANVACEQEEDACKGRENQDVPERIACTFIFFLRHALLAASRVWIGISRVCLIRTVWRVSIVFVWVFSWLISIGHFVIWFVAWLSIAFLIEISRAIASSIMRRLAISSFLRLLFLFFLFSRRWLKVDSPTEANFKVIKIVYAVIVLQKESSHPIMIATVSKLDFALEFAMVWHLNIVLLQKFVSWNPICDPVWQLEGQSRDLTSILLAPFANHAPMMVTVDILGVCLCQIIDCFQEILRREAHRVVASIHLDPFEIVSEELRRSESRICEICLPLPAHIVHGQREPLDFIGAALDECRVVISNLNWMLLRGESRDKKSDYRSIDLALLFKRVDKWRSFSFALLLRLKRGDSKYTIFVWG